jgi:glutamate-ammonia-ligase adenylyltransferase
VSDRLRRIASETWAPDAAFGALQALAQSSLELEQEISKAPDPFLAQLSKLLLVSPPMGDSLHAHPDWLGWLRSAAEAGPDEGSIVASIMYEEEWAKWVRPDEGETLELLRAFKRREYLRIAYSDISGMSDLCATVRSISDLADFTLNRAMRITWSNAAALSRGLMPSEVSGFGILALGKLGARELNYSSDIDLIFCRRPSDDPEEQKLMTRFAEKLIAELSRFGPEGFLYRVDMRLRPHGDTGPLVPTLSSLINYYESWGETWERQALIKVRPVAGDPELGQRFRDFATQYTYARQIDDAALEEIKKVKYRSEREYAQPGNRVHIKQGVGGIRDIEFYAQYLQLIFGSKVPGARASGTLKALESLNRARALLEGELERLWFAYVFLRTVEHRMQLRALTPQATVPEAGPELDNLALGLGFESGARFLSVLERYRKSVRQVAERVYLTTGYVRPSERDEEVSLLLSDRAPRLRVERFLSRFGFQDYRKAWENLRLIGLGPAGSLLPPGERRAFLQIVHPLLEVLRDSIDPDQALHNLESFLTSTGNRLSFLRTLASRRPHLVRLTNLLALSNLCREILVRNPEYFDALARGIHLHEGKEPSEMTREIRERLGASPRGATRENVLRRFRQREMIRVAYRDISGLASPLDVSGELSALAEACVLSAIEWTRPEPARIPDDYTEKLRAVALGKFGARQMHYASDLDLVFLYEAEPETAPEARAHYQLLQDGRVEGMLRILGGVTSGGLVFRIDLRLRPEGGSGLLSRSYESFLDHARQYMQPWERMALVRSRVLGNQGSGRWEQILDEIVYDYRWDEEALGSIRHLKRRIENEKNKESRMRLDFKYGRGAIVDLEFLVQFLQLRLGPVHRAVRAPATADAVPALHAAGAITGAERDLLLRANLFSRKVENHYQLMEEWNLREISRDSPALLRLARSVGYSGVSSAEIRRRFLSDWDENAAAVRALVNQYFYGS